MHLDRSAPLALAAAAVFVIFVEAASASAETVRIAHATWVGYGPLYVARDKGFFKEHGVDVELSVVEEAKNRFPEMMAGTFDMIASTVDAALLYVKARDEFQYVLAIDDSNGGDGIVANKDIKSIGDLKGKRVAFSAGSVSQFYLDVLLAKAGLKESDLVPVDMSAGNAGGAFAAKKVDAAVTWEPWLTRGKKSVHGHLLIDSSTTPGLITDVMITTRVFAARHPKAVAGVVAAWNEAVAYARTHPDVANLIMAKGVGGWLKDPKVFAETLEGVRFFGADDNKTFFGTRANPGPIYESVKDAIDVWSTHGKLQLKVSPTDMINYSFVNG